MQHVRIRQRPRIHLPHMRKHILLALRLIHRQIRVLLQPANRIRRTGTLADQPHNLRVQSINPRPQCLDLPLLIQSQTSLQLRKLRARALSYPPSSTHLRNALPYRMHVRPHPATQLRNKPAHRFRRAASTLALN